MVGVAVGGHDEHESHHERYDHTEQGAEERGLSGLQQVGDLGLETHHEQQEDHSQLGEGVDDRIHSAPVVLGIARFGHGHIQKIFHQVEVADDQIGHDDTDEYLPDEPGETETRDDGRAEAGQRV